MTAEQIVLVGGLWLDASAWDDVVSELETAVAVSLPVQPGATLDDQVEAVLAAVDAAPGKSVVVGHSAACSLAWIVADQRPGKVAKVVLIGGFPNADGSEYASFFPIVDGTMPFPGWDPFEGPDADDLTPEARKAFEAAAVTVPEGVAKGVVRLNDERRYDVPVTLICPEFTPDQAREWIAAGDLPELAKVKHLELIDIDSGHWPMLTRPTELAALLSSR
ncbi:alpha/beta hydrolase [Actinoplanes sp. TRM 88003]|uniref:Alpha/beta hydrolase n=1 Tax=Paractinoplanes aksuensis TaxID=2939490 RepID=A0ABT1DKY8_9ACTN|nr:alpha/beta hydrolase [Actinoplanes aksuensis]MCO8271508.1 alpha/beta hydrolase [Actinoplanes aksuensis]